MRDERIGLEGLKDAYLVCPEIMAWGIAKLSKDGQHCGNVPRPIWVVRMAGDTDKSVFSKGAGCPRLLTRVCEPSMGRFVMDVHRIAQGEQQIHIEKVRGHGASSRRRLTKSSVTTPASSWIGNTGRPCLAETGTCLVSACRARSDNTRPSVLRRCRAISLAASSTSSSRSTVVRTVSSHLTSDAHAPDV